MPESHSAPALSRLCGIFIYLAQFLWFQTICCMWSQISCKLNLNSIDTKLELWLGFDNKIFPAKAYFRLEVCIFFPSRVMLFTLGKSKRLQFHLITDSCISTLTSHFNGEKCHLFNLLNRFINYYTGLWSHCGTPNYQSWKQLRPLVWWNLIGIFKEQQIASKCKW